MTIKEMRDGLEDAERHAQRSYQDSSAGSPEEATAIALRTLVSIVASLVERDAERK